GRARGAPARPPGRGARRHQLRSRRGGLRGPGERRRDSLLQPDRASDRRRHRDRQGARRACRVRPRRRATRAAGGGPPPGGRGGGGGRARHGNGRRNGSAGAPGRQRGRGGAVSAVSAGLVKELREQTGAGMMDCKRALEETAGDLEAARTLLREKGMAQAGKRASRETTEGKVLARIDGGVGAMVAIGCETEPVSNNEEFLAFAGRALDAAFDQGPEAIAELEAERVELIAKRGENIAVRGAGRYQSGAGAR